MYYAYTLCHCATCIVLVISHVLHLEYIYIYICILFVYIYIYACILFVYIYICMYDTLKYMSMLDDDLL